jgi:hypothetical protein
VGRQLSVWHTLGYRAINGGGKPDIGVVIGGNERQASGSIERAGSMLFSRVRRKSVCKILPTGAGCNDVCSQSGDPGRFSPEYRFDSTPATDSSLGQGDLALKFGTQLSNDLPHYAEKTARCVRMSELVPGVRQRGFRRLGGYEELRVQRNARGVVRVALPQPNRGDLPDPGG